MANSWFKKEKPLLGMMGSGGGLAQGAAGPGAEVTGGTKTTNGSYTVHTFTSSGSLVVTGVDLPSVQYLVVGGGGAGGSGNYTGAAGGGAGGVVSSVPGKPGGGPVNEVTPAVPMTEGSYSMTVGDGGFIPGPAESPQTTGYNGNPSVLSYNGGTIIALGGGGGGGYGKAGVSWLGLGGWG